MVEQGGEPAHDREAEPHAARARPLGAPGHLEEFVEDALAMLGRDADAAVDDLDHDVAAAPTRADDHAASGRVPERVGHEVAEHSLEHQRIRDHRQPRAHERQRETARARLDRRFAREPREQRRERHALAARIERAGLEARQIDQLRELRFERDERGTDVGDQRRELAVVRAPSQRRHEQPERVERLAQVVASGGEELALAAIGFLGRRTRVQRRARAHPELRDQVGIAVARRERVGEDVVQPMPEREHEREHHGHHQRRVQVHRTALGAHAQDQRNQRGKHESVERRLVDGRQVETAQHDAEQADDRQRLARGGPGKHRDGGDAPQRSRRRRADRPVASPAPHGRRTRMCATPRAHQHSPPTLVGDDQRDPRAHQRGRRLVPHRRAEQRAAEQHRRRRSRPARVEGRDLVRACARERGRRRERGGEARVHACARARVSRRGPTRRRRRAARARRSPACACGR